jgi:hypothetical protein
MMKQELECEAMRVALFNSPFVVSEKGVCLDEGKVIFGIILHRFGFSGFGANL